MKRVNGKDEKRESDEMGNGGNGEIASWGSGPPRKSGISKNGKMWKGEHGGKRKGNWRDD